ncbi:hypothetical protein [Campylobacter sp. P0109]|uniref:hypothetical protein n=1 Tax=Campylobacter sp. P0109 TaxID=1895606 RepID=UPI000A3322C8|nr:hypothetical protein [Campylobacter sp. P0109]
MGWFSEVSTKKSVEMSVAVTIAIESSRRTLRAVRTFFGYRIPIKFDLANKQFDNYIRISDITNTKPGKKIHKRKPVVSQNGVWFFRSSGHFNYYTGSFNEACDKLSVCVLKDEVLREIAFRDLDVFIEKDFAEAYLNKRTSECPFNMQDLEIALIKEFLNYLKTEYEKIVFEPVASEKIMLENVEKEIEGKIQNIKEMIKKLQNSDFFYKRVSKILD